LASKRNKKKQKNARQRARRAAAKPEPREEPTHPTPLEAIEMKGAELATRLGDREDRFSQLLSKASRSERSGDSFVSSSGLSKEEHVELESLREGAHARFQKEVAEGMSRLRGLLAHGDPFYILSVIQASNLLVGRGGYYEPTHRGLESKVELVAGLVLTQPAPPEPTKVSDAAMRAIHDELDQLMDLLLLRNLSAPKGDDPLVSQLRFEGALHWMTLRGSSYEHHGRDLARALYRPFDSWSFKRYGFTVDDVLCVGAAVDQLWTESMSYLLAEARGFAEKVATQVREPELREQLDAEERAKLDSPEAVARLLERASIEVFERGVDEATTFTAQDLLDRGLPEDRVKAVLRELSRSVGSLSLSDYSGLFDKSPLVEHPFVELDGLFLLAVPGMLLRDTVALLESRFMTGVSTFSKARAKTLDALAVDHLRTALPDSEGFTNLFYGEYELDGLVIFERTAFVVEGKGTSLSIPAQRGDVVRLRRDLERAVEEAWVQGARARDYLLSDDDAVFRDAAGSEVLCIPARTVDEVRVVNPTLHELAGHAPQLPRLRKLGLFPDGEFPWSVFVNDLRVISETCDNAAVFLHYLVWRERLPLGEQVTVTDELDLWGRYLLCERFGSLADEGHYIIGNSSTDFDAYYDGVVGNGPKKPKPGKFLEEPVRSFVARMASERPLGWLDAAGACLDLSIPELAFVCGEADRTWREANSTGDLVISEVGRVRLVGLPGGARVWDVVAEIERDETDVVFHLYIQGSKARRGHIVWASRVKPITFELSAYEKAVFQQ
jgi:hypothetical protein